MPEEVSRLNTLSTNPTVASLPLVHMDQGAVSTKDFFVRNHFPVPEIDAAGWSLSLAGLVKNSFSLTYQDIMSMPAKEITVLLECAGNSRSAVQPPVEGLLWDHGGVGSACWLGVPVETVLEKAGLLPEAQEVLFRGADHGTERGAVGESNFAMSLPLEKALHPDTLLAYRMNGESLAPEHGFPLRVVVPGWYGMASVKWLTSIEVLERPFEGFHQADYYVYVGQGDDDDSPKERVSSIQVKSLITWPRRGESLVPGVHVIRGMAWAGKGPVTTVEISTDGGQIWNSAKVVPAQSPYDWHSWEFNWEASQTGYYLVMVRATDSEGVRQPERATWNFRGFANNSFHSVPVQVRSGG